MERRCDYFDDCFDKSDEKGCPYPTRKLSVHSTSICNCIDFLDAKNNFNNINLPLFSYHAILCHSIISCITKVKVKVKA